jgi:ribosomal protein S18 acetylase RimI-like enzyme
MDTARPAALARELRRDEATWVAERLREAWGSLEVVSRGRLIDPTTLPGVVVESGSERVGLATYDVVGDVCELVTINAFVDGLGVGAALVEAVCDKARARGCRRLWLITTNDNTRALRFYQRHGFRLVDLHLGAIEESRRLKPAIPLIGNDGIPIRDEIELARDL